MPPKIKVTKDEIINNAIEIVRKDGEQSINARTIATQLNCSTQPIFSNFATMDDLRLAVTQKADELYQSYIQREIASEQFPSYKASGMAYIRFAKEEKELFKALYMRQRREDTSYEALHFGAPMEQLVEENTGLSGDRMKLFHLEMWAYVHGIAVMFATGFLDLEWELVSQMLTDAYQGLKKQYEKE